MSQNIHIYSKSIATVAKLVAAGKPVPQTLAWAADFDRNHAGEISARAANPTRTIYASVAARMASK